MMTASQKHIPQYLADQYAHMSMFDFAVAHALGREPLNSNEELCELLSRWFQGNVKILAVAEAMDRLVEQQIATRFGVHMYQHRLTVIGADLVNFWSGVFVRIIDRGMNLIDHTILFSMLNLHKENSSDSDQ